ncbi:hypothetical protein [Microvirga arsenatis]|uniref:Uncharacterized protein n=1 Tax=Microvirga arsenatis TaxID=2692265 RepID=A0ABW9YVP3_9HYPH|nr:hypothetical protein [Microvirga arsenatis]NBJ10872.1 hypothetical protein [Microvirga arsenatis]NBJ24230.1 hypothetical protein [Microvirga arsenatis]
MATFLKHSPSRRGTVQRSPWRGAGCTGYLVQPWNGDRGIHAKLFALFRKVVASFTRTTGMPAITVQETEGVLGEAPSVGEGRQPDETHRPRPSSTATLERQLSDVLGSLPQQTSFDPDRPTDMNESIDTLAQQMLTLVEIVSAQERDIKVLKEECRRLQEHDQAIAVAFSTFFHILAAGRVAKLSEMANVLNHITQIAEQEGRPAASIKFLKDLASLLPEDKG